MTGKYWVSCKQFTGMIEVKDGIITKTCPIAKVFKGQSFWNLANWAKGEIEWKKLTNSNPNSKC